LSVQCVAPRHADAVRNLPSIIAGELFQRCISNVVGDYGQATCGCQEDFASRSRARADDRKERRMGSTLHDVARLAGVSIKTVSNVVNNYPHVRPSTRDKVLAAIEELDYRPNLSARGLRSGRTGVIGLAIPELRQNYFAELADSIIRAADARGIGVVIDQTSATREGEIAALSGERLRLTDGVLFSPERLGQEDVALLDVSYPLVLLGERIFGGPT